ncbi:hypothetical protein D3C86_1715500 [compost metagenome]
MKRSFSALNGPVARYHLIGGSCPVSRQKGMVSKFEQRIVRESELVLRPFEKCSEHDFLQIQISLFSLMVRQSPSMIFLRAFFERALSRSPRLESLVS